MILNKNRVGIAVGLFLALFHAVWSILVAIIPEGLQSFMNWILELHAIEPFMIITSFNLINAIMLVIMTFIFGFVIGWVYAWTHNLSHKK